LGVSLGLALIPIVYFSWKRKWYKEPLVWLFILPVIYYAVDLAPQTYVYMMPAIGFGAVIAGIGLSRMKPFGKLQIDWKWAVLGCAVALLAFNADYFDIGRTLDPELSASEYYYKELDKVPDGQILLAQQGWEWAAVAMYNKENNRTIRPACSGIVFVEQLQYWNIKYEDSPNLPNIAERFDYITQSIVRLNDNVWITKPTTPRTYGAEIVPAKGNEDSLTWGVRHFPSTEWHWKPSNPYDIITGAIEVEEWKDILVSNYSCLMFGMLGTVGFVPAWIGYKVIVEKKKWSLKKNKEVRTSVTNTN
jgi:hypothetical protein